MNQRDFAAAVGMSPSSLSSLFNGHTSPTNNLIQAIHRRFPEISITWLMFGERNMITNENQEQATAVAGGATSSTPLPDKKAIPQQDESVLFPAETGDSFIQMANKETTPSGQTIIREVKYIDKPQRRITEIRVFYDDGTFDTFSGK